IPVRCNPFRKKFRQAQMIANERGESFAAECAPNNPRFKRAKTSAQLHAVIHVIDFGPFGIAQVQMFGRECEESSQTVNIADVKGTKIKWHKKRLVRINDDRIRLAPTGVDPFTYGQKRKAGTISTVDV